MTKAHDFSNPDELSDVALIVEGRKLHVNKIFLSKMSSIFYNMFMKDSSESKEAEVRLNGPPGDPLKYDQFLELMKVVHSPFKDINARTVESLLELAHHFDMDLVFRRANDFLAYKDHNHRLVSLIKRMVMIDKYGDKMVATKRLFLNEFKKPVVARDLMKKAEYAKLSVETKTELLQALVDANSFVNDPKIPNIPKRICLGPKMTEPDWNWGESSNYNSGYNQGWSQQPQNPPTDFYSEATTKARLRSKTPPQPDAYNGYNGWEEQQPPHNFYGQQPQDPYGQQFNGYGAQPPPSNYFGDTTFQMGQGFAGNYMADPMLNVAKQIGGHFAEEQKQKLTQLLGTFNLKYYFAVDTNYVRKKLGALMFPFFRDWQFKLGNAGEPAQPKNDVNAPDLYIPLMAFITYVFVAGFVFGIQKRFSPEKLGLLTTNAMFYLVLENLLIFITKYVLNISQSLNVWHTLAFTMYKYVGMVICLLLFLVGGTNVYYCALAYCIVTTVFFLLRSLKTFVLDISGYDYDGGRKRKYYLILSLVITQSLIMWLLTSSVTSYMPDNYDFAKMAMSGIGLSNKDAVPRLPDGDVDYEALMKNAPMAPH